MPGLMENAWRALTSPGGFGRFLASGGVNTVVTYALYLLLLRRLPYTVSFSIAFAVGIALAYVMNRYLVFRQPGGRAGPLWVAAIYIGQYLLSLAIVRIGVEWLSVRPAFAPLVAIVLTLPVTYLLNRLVFSEQRARVAADIRASAAVVWAWRGRALVGVLVGLPLLSLVLNGVNWLRLGIDLPFFDDWRGYDFWDIDSLDFIYLFRPLNDTLTPIGLALDALAQRYLDGNSVAYQFLSMVVVLGGLLLLQWKLLRLVLGDPLRTAACFVFTLLMLQPGSYWGRENLAFQQALPLVAILGALWLVLERRAREWWALPAVFALGMAAGLTYISGAFGALAAGAGLLVALALAGRAADDGRLWRGGAALTAAGLLVSAIQVWMVIVPQKGQTHVGANTMALPHEPTFWFFYLGKIGRSLLLPASAPEWSLALVGVACAAVVALAVWAVRRARADRGDAAVREFVVVLGAMTAMVFVYLLMVAAGRANFRPVSVREPLDVFVWGFSRFHFFWATLLWPWLIAGGLLLARHRFAAWAARPATQLAGWLVVAAAVWGMVEAGAFAHDEGYRREAEGRLPTVACLAAKLQTGERIDCPEIRHLGIPDLTPAYVYATHIGASFVRSFPVHPVPTGSDAIAPWLRWRGDASRLRAQEAERRADGMWVSRGDAQLVFDVGRPEEMARCAMLDVQGRLRVRAPDQVMVFFQPWGHTQFSRYAFASQPIGPDRETFFLRIHSPLGFGDTLRLDPIVGPGEFELLEVEVRCRLRTRTEGREPFFELAHTRLPIQLHGLEPLPDGSGRFRALEEAQAVFRSGLRYRMATCRVLEVDARFTVERDDMAQIYFRPRGEARFSEANSRSLPVRGSPQVQRLVFELESPSGFDDELRFDPVRTPQSIRFENLQLRCQKRTLRIRDD